ncbi:MAG: hypothetical protein IPP47_18700 [Bryobacterales bacterium]|nr:hypothetical protein [Bryobacterales bacterium]
MSRPFVLVPHDYELGERRGNEVVAAVRGRYFTDKILIATVGLQLAEVPCPERRGRLWDLS